jgi:hypothetical protein
VGEAASAVGAATAVTRTARMKTKALQERRTTDGGTKL